MLFLILLICLFFPSSVFADSLVKISGYSATNPEYVKLSNSSSDPVDITGWYFKDLVGTKKLINYTSIPANSEIQNDYTTGWLNDDGDTIYLYDSSNSLIDTLVYITPTKTPTPTLTPTQTPTPTLTPTSDSTVTNPTSGISLSEFMPYSTIEWIEIYNNNSYPVKLVGWKVSDNASNSRSISDLTISANSYATFDFSNLLNQDGDTVSLVNNSGNVVSQRVYENNKYTLDYSWSSINGSWCQASITKGYENVTNCYTAPTATATPTSSFTPTPTPDSTKYTDDDNATESAIIEPADESSFLEITPTSASNDGLTLGSTLTDMDTTVSNKKNYLPLIFIIGGGLLLTSPVIITQIKKIKNRK